MKFRTMQINGLRGLLSEYGEVMGKGRAALDKEIPAALDRIAERLPTSLLDTLREQWNGLTRLDGQIAEIERRMRQWKKEDKAVKAISEIPGVGLLTATAAVAMMGDPKAFKSGREFAARAGLVHSISVEERHVIAALPGKCAKPHKSDEDSGTCFVTKFHHGDFLHQARSLPERRWRSGRLAK